ncbi:hypothetical protein MBSD_n2137 [Mizugakiibacter sediminis]|uniref:Uncharacterized protein n=1 Tax=Mizugakiibacter sediminis TaxID=1475481 RepID=A0A0K8QR16_9GAMM|nr:YdaS family helix-turn-helix protein [Mizugakiibacter sediminis]GAP66822.1 hypothetical protein MBSD_n2137 [Mizugakiibacter sediminis]
MATKHVSTIPVREAVELVGGQTALARLVCVTQGLVWQWVNDRLLVTVERAIAIDKATDGRVPCTRIRPDLAEQFGASKKRKKVA